MPKKAIAELVLSGLKKLADKTETKIDDELIENTEKWLRENNLLNPLPEEELKKSEKTSPTKE